MSTLPADSNARKDIPLFSGCLMYFAAALAGVARHSKRGNDKHNPGQPLHWSRGKSSDHADCVVRHLFDIGDMQARIEREGVLTSGPEGIKALLEEADALVWRSAALSQELYEKYGGAPISAASKGVEVTFSSVTLKDKRVELPPGTFTKCHLCGGMGLVDGHHAGDTCPRCGGNGVEPEKLITKGWAEGPTPQSGDVVTVAPVQTGWIESSALIGAKEKALNCACGRFVVYKRVGWLSIDGVKHHQDQCV